MNCLQDTNELKWLLNWCIGVKYRTYVHYFSHYGLLFISCLSPSTNLEVVHSVGQCHDEAWVVVDGFVAEDDVHAVVQVSEVVFRRRQLTGVIFWVVPVKHMKEARVTRLIYLFIYFNPKRRQKADWTERTNK